MDADEPDTSPIFNETPDDDATDDDEPDTSPIFNETPDDDTTDDDEPDTSPIFNETPDDDTTDDDEPDTSPIFDDTTDDELDTSPVLDDEPDDAPQRIQTGLLRLSVAPGTNGPSVPIFDDMARPAITDPEHRIERRRKAPGSGVGRTLVAAPAKADLTVTTAGGSEVELHKYSSSEIAAVVKAQEGALVETLIDEGLLTTDGPITDRDVRTMVFVAVSSNELVELLTSEHDDEQHFWPPRPAELAEGGAA